MLKIKIIVAGAAVAAAATVGVATMAHSQPATADTSKAAATTQMAVPVPVEAGTVVDAKFSDATADQHRVVTNILNRSGQGMTLLEPSTLDNAPFSSDGGYRLPKTGDAVSDGSAYSYLNTVALPNAAMKTTTTWKIGTDATVKISQDSTEAAPECEISGPKAADYTCKNRIGSGNGADVTDVVISKR
jgi:hypothetical protein